MVMLTWLAAFGVAIGVDFTYAKWVTSIAGRRRTPAALFSALCTVLGTVSVVVCVGEYSAIIPTALGHALGTWIAVGRREGEKKDGP